MSETDPPEQTEGQGIVNEKVTDEYIVDTDFHLEIGEEILVDRYIDDQRIASKLKKFGTPPEARAMGGLSLQYAHNEPVSNTFHGEALNADEIHKVMEDFGLDDVIVTPTNHLPFGLTNYPRLSSELASAYNQYLLDDVIDVNRGVHANLVIPYWDTEEAVAEIDRMAANEGIVGAHAFMLPKLWGNHEYDPILEALAEHDLPLAPHIAALSAGDLLDDQFTTWVEHTMTGLGSNLIANVVSMITSGVFDRYPELDTVWLEAGTQWIPYVANRLNDAYQIYHKDFELQPQFFDAEQQYLEKMPREYVFDNMFVGTQPIALPNHSKEAEAVLTACHAEDMFVFATDWPHHSADVSNWLFETPGLDDEMLSAISHENAREAYRLPK